MKPREYRYHKRHIKPKWIKNIVHQVIKCGGKNIDMNFFKELFDESKRTN